MLRYGTYKYGHIEIMNNKHIENMNNKIMNNKQYFSNISLGITLEITLSRILL